MDNQKNRRAAQAEDANFDMAQQHLRAIKGLIAGYFLQQDGDMRLFPGVMALLYSDFLTDSYRMGCVSVEHLVTVLDALKEAVLTQVAIEDIRSATKARVEAAEEARAKAQGPSHPSGPSLN